MRNFHPLIRHFIVNLKSVAMNHAIPNSIPLILTAGAGDSGADKERAALFGSRRGTTIIVATALAICVADRAPGSITLTAGVPNGSTSLPGIVQFSAANDATSFATPAQEVQFASGVTGSQIALGLRDALESGSSFDGIVSGSSLSIPAACEGEITQAPLEYGMSLMVEPCAGTPVPHPDFDLSVDRFEHDILGFALVGDRILTAGSLRLSIRIGGDTLTRSFLFDPSMSTRELLAAMSEELRRRSTDWVEGRFTGLHNGYLLFEVDTGGTGVPLEIEMTAERGASGSGLMVSVLHALGIPRPSEPETYDGWIAGFPELRGDDRLPESDPDGDGLPNSGERTHGTHPGLSSLPNGADPNWRNAPRLLVNSDVEASLEFSFDRLAMRGEGDRVAVLETSTDSRNWLALPIDRELAGFLTRVRLDRSGRAPLTPWERFCLLTAEAGTDLRACLDGASPSSREQVIARIQQNEPLNAWERFCLATSEPGEDLDACLESGTPDRRGSLPLLEAFAAAVDDAGPRAPLSPWEKFCLTVSGPGDLSACLDARTAPSSPVQLVTKLRQGEPLDPWERFCLATAAPGELAACLGSSAPPSATDRQYLLLIAAALSGADARFHRLSYTSLDDRR